MPEMSASTTANTAPASAASFHANLSSTTLGQDNDGQVTARTASLHSNLSSTTLGQDANNQHPAPAQPESAASSPRYIYTKKTGRPPNPDAQPKSKSALGKFMSKFQSPAVRQGNDARDRELLEEERTGVKIWTATETPTGQGSAGAFQAGGVIGGWYSRWPPQRQE